MTEELTTETTEQTEQAEKPTEPENPSMDDLLGEKAQPKDENVAQLHIHQKVSSLESKFSQLGDKLDKLIEAGSAGKSTAKAENQATKTFAELERMLTGDGDEFVSKKDLAVLADAIKQAGQGDTQDLDKVLQEKLNPIQDEFAKQQRELALAQYETKWDKQFPHIAGRINEIVGRAEKLVDEQYPGSSGERRVGLVEAELTRLSRIANGKAKQLGSSRKSPESTEGADSASGASGTPAKTDGIKRYTSGPAKGLPVGLGGFD